VSLGTVLVLVLLLLLLTPVLQRMAVARRRVRAIEALEKARGTRVIALIHRQETVGFLGVPLFRFIDIEDSEDVLRAIRMTPDDRPIDLVLHTPGGLVLASEQIAYALRAHPGRVTVLVPHYAMSGGTLIALAADEIRLDQAAVLGPVDPQLGDLPAASILRAVSKKPVERLDDRTLIMADVAEKAVRHMKEIVRSLVELAHRLGLETVAEGVENRVAWEAAASLGCDLAQGFYLGHPMPAGELTKWLAGTWPIAPVTTTSPR